MHTWGGELHNEDLAGDEGETCEALPWGENFEAYLVSNDTIDLVLDGVFDVAENRRFGALPYDELRGFDIDILVNG